MVGRPKLKFDYIPREVVENYENYKNGILNKVNYAKVCGVSRPRLNKYWILIYEN